jgi:hypothetical protein
MVQISQRDWRRIAFVLSGSHAFFPKLPPFFLNCGKVFLSGFSLLILFSLFFRFTPFKISQP